MNHIGIIVGRFQSPYVTEGHKAVIRIAAKAEDEIVFFLLDNKIPFSERNPLPYDIREKMLSTYMLGEFKHKKFRFFALQEQKYAGSMQRAIDYTMTKNFDSKDAFTMYGGPGSYAERYGGLATVQMIDRIYGMNSGDARRCAYDMEVQTTNLLQGVIHALNYRSPVCYNYIVNVVLYDKGESTEILVVDDSRMRHHVLPTFEVNNAHSSFEAQAISEITKIIPTAILGNTTHVKSFKVADWRFRNSQDFCYYHLVLYRFMNRPALPVGMVTIPRPLKVEEFEDEYANIIHYIEKVI